MKYEDLFSKDIRVSLLESEVDYLLCVLSERNDVLSKKIQTRLEEEKAAVNELKAFYGTREVEEDYGKESK